MLLFKIFKNLFKSLISRHLFIQKNLLQNSKCFLTLKIIIMNLQELTFEEMIEINAGETAWYWVAYYTRVGLEYLNEVGKGGRLHSAG